MNATAAKTVYAPEDLLTMPDGDLYELVDGQLVARKMSMQSSWIAGRMFRYLDEYVEARELGWAFPEGTGYQCFPAAPRKVRKPDVSFIRRERLPVDAATEGHAPTAPDLAVEVISPDDRAWEIDQKVTEYLEAGVPLVWVIHPKNRMVAVYRAGAPGSLLGPDAELSGEDILPGFRCRVAALFPPGRKPRRLRYGPERTVFYVKRVTTQDAEDAEPRPGGNLGRGAEADVWNCWVHRGAPGEPHPGGGAAPTGISRVR